MQHILDEAIDQQRFASSDSRKLQSFLGGDNAPLKNMSERGIFLDILREKHIEIRNASN